MKNNQLVTMLMLLAVIAVPGLLSAEEGSLAKSTDSVVAEAKSISGEVKAEVTDVKTEGEAVVSEEDKKSEEAVPAISDVVKSIEVDSAKSDSVKN